MRAGAGKSAKPPKQFICPQCAGKDYSQVTTRDVFGQVRETGVYECSHCHFGFIYPERYALGQTRQTR